MSLAGINSRGLERRGFDRETIARIERSYRYLFRRSLRVEEALQKILAEGDDEIARTYRDFFARSDRGSVR
jgi:UDP-N-acetylglucosamine acyltransferase